MIGKIIPVSKVTFSVSRINRLEYITHLLILKYFCNIRSKLILSLLKYLHYLITSP